MTVAVRKGSPVATIGNTESAEKYLSTSTVSVETAEGGADTLRNTKTQVGFAYRTAVAKLRESARRTRTAGGSKLTPWTDEELSAAINRLHSYFFGGERPAIPEAHESRVQFGFAIAAIKGGLTNLPGQSAEWYPQALKDAQGFLARPKSNAKKPATARMTDTGNTLVAVG